MKTPTLLLAILLSSCALSPTKFDNVQYSSLVDIRQSTEKVEMCQSQDEQITLANILQAQIDWSAKYAEYRPNKQINTMFTLLKVEADTFVKHSEQRANPTYCKLKLQTIQEQSTIIQKALGKLGS